MIGAALFQSQAQAAAAGVRGIGDAADTTAGKSKRLNGALTSIGSATAKMGALASRGALAFGAAGVAAAGMGLKFDAGMEQSRVAFTNLLGNAADAQGMLDRLYKIAAKTPFEFPQLTQSTQRLLGFGMAAKDVIPTMQAVGDAVAAAGGGGEQIDRISTALGQIQAKGKVSSEELMQMAESGIPALKILGDQLGLTGQQLTDKLKKGAIDADTGIQALVAGIGKRYKGMAEAQSKTFSGMLSTLKDNAKQVLGAVMLPLFDVLRDKVLPQVNKVTEGISKWARSGGVTTAMNALRAGFTKGAGSATKGFSGMNATLVKVGDFLSKAFKAASSAFRQLMTALEPAMPFLRNVMLPLLKGVAIGVGISVVSAFKVLIPIIRIFATILGWIGTKLAPFRGTIEKIGIVLGVVFGPVILKAIGALGKFGGAFRLLAGAAKIAAAPLRILGALFRGIISILGRLFGVMSKIGPKAFEAAKALTRPFSALGDKFVTFGKAIITGIVNGIKAAPGAILNAIKSMLPGGKVGSLIRKAIPGLAMGGIITRPGLAMVGERGPELLGLDRGARVMPLPSPTIAPIAVGGLGGNLSVAPVYLDGRVVGEVMAQRVADKRARR